MAVRHTVNQQIRFLRTLGFRFSAINKARRIEAIKEFQSAYNLGPALTVDGIYGAKTSIAMDRVIKSGGKASKNFTFLEFQCKCGGRYSSCRGIKLNRKLLQSLEETRSTIYENQPISIISAYRCVDHNRAVGGAKNSQHLKGSAIDIEAVKPLESDWPRDIKGIGYDKRSKLVRHLDTRTAVKRVTWTY